MSRIPRPASWSFEWGEWVLIETSTCLGWGLTRDILADSRTEHEVVTEEVHETACLLRFIESDEQLLSNQVNLTGEGHQRLVEDHFLLKVMNCSDEVQLLYGVGKAKSSALGFVIAGNCLDKVAWSLDVTQMVLYKFNFHCQTILFALSIPTPSSTPPSPPKFCAH